jgi:hypothetical protein
MRNFFRGNPFILTISSQSTIPLKFTLEFEFLQLEVSVIGVILYVFYLSLLFHYVFSPRRKSWVKFYVMS